MKKTKRDRGIEKSIETVLGPFIPAENAFLDGKCGICYPNPCIHDGPKPPRQLELNTDDVSSEQIAEVKKNYEENSSYSKKICDLVEHLTLRAELAGLVAKTLWMARDAYYKYVDDVTSKERIKLQGVVIPDDSSRAFWTSNHATVWIKPHDNLPSGSYILETGQPPTPAPKYRELTRVEALNICKIAFNASQQWLKEQGFEIFSWNTVLENQEAREALIASVMIMWGDNQSSKVSIFLSGENWPAMGGLVTQRSQYHQDAWRLFKDFTKKMIDVACRLPEVKEMATCGDLYCWCTGRKLSIASMTLTNQHCKMKEQSK